MVKKMTSVCNMLLVEALIKSKDSLSKIINLLSSYRLYPDFDKRLNDWMEKNAWICEEKIEPVLKKVKKLRNENGELPGI